MNPTKPSCAHHSPIFTGLTVSLCLFVVMGVHSCEARAVIADATPSNAWHSCGTNLECAQVPVPLDWDRPGDAKISLAVVRHLASKPNQKIGSLFVNFGGPGVASVPFVKASGEELDKLGGGRFDVVGWDPRGTGESTHIVCFGSDAKMLQFWGDDWTVPTSNLSSWLYVPKTVEYMERCTFMTGSLMAHLSTMDSARDLDYLRQLVGDRKLTYRGLSYGTFLGQTYINMFPHNVRAAILDANIDPVPFTASVEAGLTNNGGDGDLVLTQFLSLCEQAGPINCKFTGDVTLRLRDLMARLEKGPIPAPRAPAPHQLRYGDFILVLWTTLRGPASWPQLADDLNQAANGDGSNLAISFSEQRPVILNALVSATTLQCTDKPLPRPGAVLNWQNAVQQITKTNFLGLTDVWWLWAPCASRFVPSAERYRGPWNATTDNPILVIGNRYDPRTKYGNAVVAAQRLGNASLLTLDGYGHTSDVDPSDCIDEAVTSYLITTVPPPNGTVCKPNHKPFDPDFGQPLSIGPQLFE